MNTLSSLLKNLRNRTPVGSLQMYAGSTPPTDWLMCDGAAVSRETFSALFDLIGTTYGAGDGTTTFNLPDMRGRMPIGADSTYALNSSGGAATILLTDQQIAHGHGFTQPTVNGGSHRHRTFTYAGRTIYKYTNNDTPARWTQEFTNYTDYDGGHTHSVSGGAVHNLHGASSTRTAHNNMPPYRGINFIIYAGTTASS